MDRAAVELLPPLAYHDTDWERAACTSYVVRQTVAYEYPEAIRDLRQRLMLVPPERHGDQCALGWGIDVSQEVRRREWTDRFGNRVVDIEADAVERAIVFEAWSLIERRCVGQPPPVTLDRAWTSPTVLTSADGVLAGVADELRAGPGGAALGERICDWVHRHMAYGYDVTSIHTTAAAALAIGSGVCQDYAHIALALCRQCGLPARYVSGHLLGEGGSHAWIEVLVARPDHPSEGHVVPLDPTNNRRAGLTYLTVATGRDYMDVAPMSGSYQALVPGTLSVHKDAALVSVAYRDQ